MSDDELHLDRTASFVVTACACCAVLPMPGLLKADQQRAAKPATHAHCVRRAALELAPRHPRLHKLLGSALFAMGDLPGAESALRRALNLRPDYADAWCVHLLHSIFVWHEWHHKTVRVSGRETRYGLWGASATVGRARTSTSAALCIRVSATQRVMYWC